MEGCRRRGLLAPSALPGKAAAGGGRKPPACREDNVIGGHAVEATSFAPARPEEYRKVFGAASACSIPVLDLPSASDGCGCLGFSALDYVDIFGGFDGRDFGVPYEELFFAATEESSGTGEPPSPLPAPDDTAPLSANTCISRRSKEMSRLTHEIPLPEWPGGDSIGSSLSRVVHHLSDGTKQTNLSDHTASWNSKDDPVHGEIHKNQVHAISISTNFVEHTKTNIPDIQVVTDICLYSSGSKETMKGQHLKKTVIIGPESGWQPIPLTDVITASAVKKAYRKAMLYIHPDKIQQRSASVQQKYICEKVFDLLQEARNKFHSEEW